MNTEEPLWQEWWSPGTDAVIQRIHCGPHPITPDLLVEIADVLQVDVDHLRLRLITSSQLD